MLHIISKLLAVQVITTTTLITIMLFGSFCTTTEALPITSKPIEGTVENLAWEAWFMLPVGQQKTRKVTPKSIFIVPPRRNQSSSTECPPGEHLFENRCIPTVSIDTEQILLTQLTNLVLSSGDYDYDYDEDGNNSPNAEKLEGGSDVSSTSIVSNSDGPLKFDIFRNSFPSGLSGSGDSSESDENIFFLGERHSRPSTPVVPDLDTESSSHAINNKSDKESESEDGSTLFLSGIDAILIPAVSEGHEKDQKYNISIFKDVDNATVGNNEMEVMTPIAEKKVDLEKILEDESLFLDKVHELEEKDMTMTETSESSTDLFEMETTTLKLEEDEEVESKTEVPRSITEVTPEEEETTIISTLPTEISYPEKEDTTTSMLPSEETTMTQVAETDITTNTNLDAETTMISRTDPTDRSTIFNPQAAESKPPSTETGERFVYQHQRDEKRPPPAIDLNAEMKIINALVAKKRQASAATPTPSAEPTLKTSDLWTKIIPVSNPNRQILVESPNSSSTVRKSSNNSYSSSKPIITPLPASEESQRSLSDSSTVITSTSPPPAISGSDPFWWLPTGWRVDRTAEDRPLLLRFWSALSNISGSQTKV